MPQPELSSSFLYLGLRTSRLPPTLTQLPLPILSQPGLRSIIWMELTWIMKTLMHSMPETERPRHVKIWPTFRVVLMKRTSGLVDQFHETAPGAVASRNLSPDPCSYASLFVIRMESDLGPCSRCAMVGSMWRVLRQLPNLLNMQVCSQ